MRGLEDLGADALLDRLRAYFTRMGNLADESKLALARELVRRARRAERAEERLREVGARRGEGADP